ncbi:MAG TPA: iron-sulfur cluster assembly scaffold protein [Thermoanaerobaculia bacterium]|jgi:nitrogen fixation NifU-like protein|nr:iron-sulfur cluster assembly scaffold protein [Thermoanaerobaculia bacterium]
MNPYGDVIQEHSRNPRNYGSLDAPDIRHEDENPFCGDRMRIELSLDADRRVSAARFQGDLCAIAKAAASVLTEMIHGMALERVREMDEQELLDALRAEIQPARRNCALLPLEVLRGGITKPVA